jgi:hypothetical protein
MVERTYSRRRPRDVRRDAERLERALGTQGEDVLVPRLKELVSSYFLVFFLNENGRSSAHHLRGKSLESTNNGLRPDKPHPSTLKGRLSPTP